MNDLSFRTVDAANAFRPEADEPTSPVARFGASEPLRLDAGVDLGPWQIAYQTYGELNAERSNAIL
ncbi:MAG TPA: homoserine O-acetyltransferase, partial [Enterovirga sp.]